MPSFLILQDHHERLTGISRCNSIFRSLGSHRNRDMLGRVCPRSLEGVVILYRLVSVVLAALDRGTARLGFLVNDHAAGPERIAAGRMLCGHRDLELAGFVGLDDDVIQPVFWASSMNPLPVVSTWIS